MSMFEPSRSAWNGRMLSVLRIVAGLLFLEHGTQKVLGFPPSPMMPTPVEIGSLLGVAGTIEIIGGVAIILGLFTRPVAFVLAGEMATAYFTQHFPRSFFPVNSGGELAVLYCFTFLYFIFAGAGPWSLDAKIARSRGSKQSGDASRERIHSAA